MRAAVIHGPRDVRLETIDTPSIRNDEILVKVKACGICGTDMHTYKYGAIYDFGQPTIMGHEFSGEIVEVGNAVNGLRVGDRVLGAGFRNCGKCYWCQQGKPRKCVRHAMTGYGLPGAFAEYIVIPNPALDRLVFKIPETLSWKEAALVEPMAISCHAVERAVIQPNENMVVIGMGAIGLGIVQAAKAMGAAKVIAIQPSVRRRLLAKQLGADVVLNPREIDAVEAVREATSHNMSPLVFECSGSPIAFRQSLIMTQAFGRVIVVGDFEQNLELEPSLINLMTTKNLTLRGIGGPKWDTALKLVLNGQIKTLELITHEFSLNEINEAFETQLNSKEVIKIIITP